MNATGTLSIRIRDDIKARIDSAADADGRTTSSLVGIILQRWLDGGDYKPDFARAAVAPNEPASRLRRAPGRPRSVIPTQGTHPYRPLIEPWLAGRERVTVEEVFEDAMQISPATASEPQARAVRNLLHELGYVEFFELQDNGDEILVWILPTH